MRSRAERQHPQQQRITDTTDTTDTNPASHATMQPLPFTTLCLVCVLLLAPAAYAKEAVLREGQATEQGLVDALAPPLSRQWAPGERPPPAKASLLITFITSSTELTAGSQRLLDTLASALKNDRLAALRFTIEGHADPRGGAEFNRRLSQARAEKVRDYLVTKHGLDAARLQPEGKGASELLNRQRSSAPENRRVTIVARPLAP